MAAEEDVILEIQAVTRAFGAVVAVDALSERFRRGEYFCILGPSGCGKTTLLRLIAGFEQPDSGAIRLHGRDVVGVPPERRDVNVVFQSYALFPHLTVRENIGFGLRMKKLPADEVRRRTDEVVALVHLEAEADRVPRQLSGGQQQRVALARALVNRPAVLLLDEPLSALDQSLRQRMQEELRQVQRETGVTFIHITHDQAEALSLADRVAVMRAGRFEQVAPPRGIYRSPATRFVAGFVGAMNLLPARWTSDDVLAVADAVHVRLPGTPRRADPVLAAVRPESLRFAAPGSVNTLHGTLLHAGFAGALLDCTVLLDDGTTTVRVLAPSDGAGVPPEGEPVALAFAADAVVLLPGDRP